VVGEMIYGAEIASIIGPSMIPANTSPIKDWKP
jgi:hypothetical protein